MLWSSLTYRLPCALTPLNPCLGLTDLNWSCCDIIDSADSVASWTSYWLCWTWTPLTLLWRDSWGTALAVGTLEMTIGLAVWNKHVKLLLCVYMCRLGQDNQVCNIVYLFCAEVCTKLQIYINKMYKICYTYGRIPNKLYIFGEIFTKFFIPFSMNI